ncbi:MAG: sugar ABC transporter permease, partial [Anaerolineae bacterium]|nr:sugar ABC transporter permease [Anaerolineae bacterium]
MEATVRSTVSQVTPKPHRRSLLKSMWQARFHYALVVPSLLFVLIFSYFPVILGMVRSLYFWDGFVTEFIGLDNFRRIATDPGLPMSIQNLGKLSIFNLLITVTVPLLVAVMIYRLPHQRSQYWFRVLFVAPIVVPSVVHALLWRSFYADQGLINRLLDLLGMHEWTRVWLGDPKTALYAVMFSGFPWVGGVTMLIYLAGLIGISSEVIDAARVDGVGTISRFTRIELPLVMGQVKLMV